MSEIDKNTLIARDVPLSSQSVKLPGRAARRVTPLDLLFVLAAVLAFSFGWRSVLGVPTVPIVVAAALLWLGIEEVAQWLGLRVSMGGWISLTRVDVVVLLAAIFVSMWNNLLLLVVIPIWLIMAALALLRIWRINADGWFHWAALLTSFMALEVGAEATRIWLSAGENGGPPSPLTHIGFHESIDGGIAVSCVLLLLLLAWWPIRQRQAWGVAVLASAAFPTVLISGWAVAGALLNQRPYGYEDSYTWLLVVFWLLGVLSAVWGLVLQRRAMSLKALSAQEVFVTAFIGFAALVGIVIVGGVDVLIFFVLYFGLTRLFGIVIMGGVDVLFLPVVIGWLIAVSTAWLRGAHVGAEGWYHRATILALFLAAEVSAEISKIWLYGGCGGRWNCFDIPTPLSSIGFHHLLDLGIGLSCILLVLLPAGRAALTWTRSSKAPFAWQPLRQSHFWLLSALLAATLPAATIGAWAAYVALSHQREYAHPFAWLMALFWLLSALSTLRCFTLQRRSEGSATSSNNVQRSSQTCIMEGEDQ
jgi:hypothetical protein